VAKFQGDRRSAKELGERVTKKERKKNITGKTEDLPFYRMGGPNNNNKNNVGSDWDPFPCQKN